MSGFRDPGPICVTTAPGSDSGTQCRACTPTPGILGQGTKGAELHVSKTTSSAAPAVSSGGGGGPCREVHFIFDPSLAVDYPLMGDAYSLPSFAGGATRRRVRIPITSSASPVEAEDFSLL
jgi:hypothetical protein